MEKKSLVSIIMPAYNSERFIKDSINSVLNQTYKNWELLIINDYSKDSTGTIIEEYSKKDARIKILNQSKNSGVVAARNRGIKESKGKYIAFLDSDDLWEKEKLDNQIEIMTQNNYYMTYTEYSYITEDGDFIKDIKVPTKLNYKDALKGNQIGCLTVVLDKERIGKFKMPDLKHEDYATWLNILKSGIQSYGIKKNLAKYRKVNNSLSSNKLKTILWTWKVFRKNEKMSFVKSVIYLNIHLFKAINKHFL